MLHALLVVCRDMAVKTVHLFFGITAQLVLVYDRILLTVMAFRAFAGCANESRAGLRGFVARPLTVHQERGKHQREPITRAMKTERNDVAIGRCPNRLMPDRLLPKSY